MTKKTLQARINQLWAYQQRHVLYAIAADIPLEDAVRMEEDRWEQYKERLANTAPPAGDALKKRR